MSSDFEWSRPVEFYETDLAGIAHFSNFYRWMESAEHAFLRERGIELHENKVGWPRVNASADFKKPIRFGEVVRVRVSVAEVRTRAVRYAFEFRVEGSEELHATGEIVAVCVDLSAMKAVEISDEVRGLLEA